MTTYSYSETEVLLCNPLAANRAATRASLLAIGFRRIDSCASLIGLTNALIRNPPHLLICDCGRDDSRLFAFLQDLRQANTLHNPFLPIILTSWGKGEGLIRNVVDSGADDFLLRPLSTDMLAHRIAAIVEGRKPFVISSDYVGPDRRFGGGRSSPELFCPPNALKSVAEPDSTNEARATLLRQEVSEARTRLHFGKLRCDALRFGAHVRQWEQAKADRCGHAEHLGRMRALASSMLKRSEKLKDDPASKECVEFISDLVALVEGTETQAVRLEKVAGDLYLSLSACCSFEKFKRDVDIYLESVQASGSAWVVLAG